MAGGVLGGPVDGPGRVANAFPVVDATPGLRVIHRGSRFVGHVRATLADGVVLRGASGDERQFRLVPGAFLVDGNVVSLRRPAPVTSSTAAAPRTTASGSVAASVQRAVVAKPSRLWVEGVHDAALVERVWGDDLRVEGIVVERLDGIDDLAARVAAFGPAPGRRLGILVDHLVEGSKESRLAASVAGPAVLVRGTPYVDVWQAVRPRTLGIESWPNVPRNEDWKTGVCRRLGLGDPVDAWRRILASVDGYADLEPAVVGAVEELIDFVTDPEA